MTSITHAQICDAVATTLGAATGLTYTQSYNQLKEGMNDLPTLQVYWDNTSGDPSGNNDRTTFHAAVRQADVQIFCDLYAAQRGEVGENMATLLPLVDAIIDEIEKQDSTTQFGLVGLKGFHWNASRVIFQYTDPLRVFYGARFILFFRVY